MLNLVNKIYLRQNGLCDPRFGAQLKSGLYLRNRDGELLNHYVEQLQPWRFCVAVVSQRQAMVRTPKLMADWPARWLAELRLLRSDV